MISTKIKITYTLAISIFITYLCFLLNKYGNLAELGSYSGHKIQLILAPMVNSLLLVIVGILIKNPNFGSTPLNIDEYRKNKLFEKIRFALVVLVILTSVFFLIMTVRVLGYNGLKTTACILSICIPISLFILVFKKKKSIHN